MARAIRKQVTTEFVSIDWRKVVVDDVQLDEATLPDSVRQAIVANLNRRLDAMMRAVLGG